MSSPTLPSGTEGLPLLGETLAFAKNPFGFIQTRLARNGRLFRTRVLGRKTAVIAGAEAAGRFIDDSVIMREGSMPPHVQELFGGRSLPLLDGEEHRARKNLVLQAFSRGAMASYLPTIQQTIERYLEHWSGSGEIRWLEEMKRLSIEVICTTVIGMTPGTEMDRLRLDYGLVTNGFATLPINWPGTRYRAALKARDRILDVLRRIVRERLRSPQDDGVSRILAAASSSGTMLTEEQAALELHHIVIAGFIVYGELGAMVMQLTNHPEVMKALSDEIERVAPRLAVTLEQLMQMPYLLQVVNEVKRLTPIVPAVFGKTKKTLEIDGRAIPPGWMVMWALGPSHVSHSVYTDPERFDPDRFSSLRAEDKRHEHAFAPQGAGPVTGHRCPGLDYATYFMELFAITLLRDYSWQLPPQSFEIDWSLTPPEPRDALRATLHRKQERVVMAM